MPIAPSFFVVGHFEVFPYTCHFFAFPVATSQKLIPSINQSDPHLMFAVFVSAMEFSTNGFEFAVAMKNKRGFGSTNRLGGGSSSSRG